MSGIRSPMEAFDGLERSAVPERGNLLKTVMVNANQKYLAFPDIGYLANDSIDQCIALNRPFSENFTHAAVAYPPASRQYRNRSYITVKPLNDVRFPGQGELTSYNKMSYAGGGYYYQEDGKTRYGLELWIAPAGQATTMNTLGFPYAASTWMNKANGISGENLNSWMSGDMFNFSVGTDLWLPGETTSHSVKTDAYVTVNYLVDMKLENAPASLAPKVFFRHRSSGGIEVGYISNNYSATGNTISNCLDRVNADPRLCTITQYEDRDAFERFNSSGEMCAYFKTNLYHPYDGTNYVTAHIPYISCCIQDFDYNSEYPDMSLTLGIQYNLVAYGVANDPTAGFYGMIYDNDGFNRRNVDINVTVATSTTRTQLYSDDAVVIEANVMSMNIMSFYVRPKIAESITFDEISRTGAVSTKLSSYSGSATQPHTDTNIPADRSSGYMFFNYSQYDLANGTKVFNDFKMKYNGRLLHFQMIKNPDMNFNSQVTLKLRVLQNK